MDQNSTEPQLQASQSRKLNIVVAKGTLGRLRIGVVILGLCTVICISIGNYGAFSKYGKLFKQVGYGSEPCDIVLLAFSVIFLILSSVWFLMLFLGLIKNEHLANKIVRPKAKVF